MKIIPSNRRTALTNGPQNQNSESLKWILVLALQEHIVPLPSHLIPSRPQERRIKSSARRDWRLHASPILQALSITRGDWCL